MKIKEEILEHINVISLIDDALISRIQEVSDTCIKAINSGGKVVFCGNGGSAADAQHLAAEFVVRYRHNRGALPGLALSTDVSNITACGNDFSFEDIFSRQVEALVTKDDVLIAITTSGNSPNVVNAAKSAKKMGVTVVAITGLKDADIHEFSDIELRMPSENTARIQEAYLLIGHLICGIVEEAFTEIPTLEK